MAHEELPAEHEDILISFLHRIIRVAVKILAVIMMFVILWGIGDVVYVLYQRLMAPPSIYWKLVIFSKLLVHSWR